MARSLEIESSQNSGDFTGIIPPDEYVEPIFDPFQSCGDFKFDENQLNERTLRFMKLKAPDKSRIVGHKQKATAMALGTTVVFGVVGGGVLLYEYRKNHR